MTPPQAISIVASCAGTKRVAPGPDLQLRRYAGLSPDRRVDAWIEVMDRARATGGCPLAADLYGGQHWRRVCEALDLVQAGDRRVEALVASAGAGLALVSDPLPSYSATFAAGDVDSVWRSAELDGDRREADRAWWSAIRRRLARAIEPVHPTIIVACGPAYVSAMQADIEAWRAAGREVIVLSTARHDDPSLRIDARLLEVVPGARSSIYGAALLLLATTQREHRWRSERMQSSLDAAVAGVEVTRPARRPASDEEIIDLIRLLEVEEPGISPTRALALLRSSGIMCEQGRLRRLAQQARA